jgi:hypothetical protein
MGYGVKTEGDATWQRRKEEIMPRGTQRLEKGFTPED